MKRIISLFIVLCLFVLVGCEDKSLSKEYKELVTESLSTDIYGLEYTKKQIKDNEEVYLKQVKTKVVSYEEKQGMLTFYEKKLREFSVEGKYEITEYKKDLESDDFEKIKLDIDLEKMLNLDNISKEEGKDNLYTVYLKDDFVQGNFSSKASDMVLILERTIDKLTRVVLTYKVNESTFEIEYKLTYTAFLKDEFE